MDSAFGTTLLLTFRLAAITTCFLLLIGIPLAYGLAQMRVGEPAKGLETIKGGLTLLAKAMGDDYRGWAGWDPRGTVRSSLNRAVFQALKGIEERDTLVQATEQLLARIDEEEWYQRQGDRIERSMEGSEGS